MRKSLKFSAIVLLATAMTALPAYALSLNLGDEGPLVDLGNDNNADATVSVDTGNLLGGDDDDGGTEADATIDVNLGSVGGDSSGSLDNIIDNDGDGGLVNLGGNNDLIDLDSDGDSLVDLGGDGDLLDLGGGALLDLSGDPEADAILEADLGGGELLDMGETGSILDLGGNDDLLDLGDGGLLDLDSSEDVALDLGNASGGSGNGGSGNGSGSGSGDDLSAAANADNAACMTLDAAQLDELIQRHNYNRTTFNSWASARSLKIVEVDFCDEAAVDVAAAAGGSSNVARLQAFLAAQAKVRAGLESKGHSASDVIAVDHSGDVLIVYVI